MPRNWMLWILATGWFLSACASAQSTDSASPLPHPDSVTEPASSPAALISPTLLPEEPPPAKAESEFTTDFSKHSVPYGEILSGGPPKDGIPNRCPRLIPVKDMNDWLNDREPVSSYKSTTMRGRIPFKS
jgi:hypothetical protein